MTPECRNREGSLTGSSSVDEVGSSTERPSDPSSVNLRLEVETKVLLVDTTNGSRGVCYNGTYKNMYR